MSQLRDDALKIWRAAVDAVDSRRLVRDSVRVEGNLLRVGNERFSLDQIRRIVVVGAGKAGAGMAQGLEEALGPAILTQKRLTGWINVPADCVRPLTAIHLHPARLPGQNEPTAEGVAGAEQILRFVEECTADDLCIALFSGGGSALLPAPVADITLADKLAVTRHLSAAGANIRQLNTVRKQLSRIKGGGLRRACHAGNLTTLIISDVLGDPLDVIASGPTVDDSSTPTEALSILELFQSAQAGISPAVFEFLRKRNATAAAPNCPTTNLVIGNNATALEAAAREATRLGYRPLVVPTDNHEGQAEEVGRRLAHLVENMRNDRTVDCLISGGEPVVQLVPVNERGAGGRNQQLVLAAAQEFIASGFAGYALVSGGTDGEDGPTDAAGAVIDAALLSEADAKGLSIEEHLRRNDAYHFFEPLGALIKTGPTHTNVCDVRVALVEPSS